METRHHACHLNADAASSPSTQWRPRPRRTAPQRRAQALRAQCRVVQSLLRGFEDLKNHRGCRPTVLGAALAELLGGPTKNQKNAPTQSDDLKETEPADLCSAESKKLVEPSLTSVDTSFQTENLSERAIVHTTQKDASAQTEEEDEQEAPPDAPKETSIRIEDNEGEQEAPPDAELNDEGEAVLTAQIDDDQAIEALDELLWPLMPFYGMRVATLQGGEVTFGSISAVDQTITGHEILYVMEYEDGDLQHSDTAAVAAAVRLAAANAPVAFPPLRQLQRRDADAHFSKQ